MRHQPQRTEKESVVSHFSGEQHLIGRQKIHVPPGPRVSNEFFNSSSVMSHPFKPGLGHKLKVQRDHKQEYREGYDMLEKQKEQQQQQEVTIPVSDLWQEAADYVELQMEGGDGGGLRSAHTAKGLRQLMPERAVFRLATQRWAARNLGAQGKPEMNTIPPNRSVLKRVRDTIHVPVERLAPGQGFGALSRLHIWREYS
ncbi:hypothetical protein PAMP_005962 [Pampus punctatissimus]